MEIDPIKRQNAFILFYLVFDQMHVQYGSKNLKPCVKMLLCCNLFLITYLPVTNNMINIAIWVKKMQNDKK